MDVILYRVSQDVLELAKTNASEAESVIEQNQLHITMDIAKCLINGEDISDYVTLPVSPLHLPLDLDGKNGDKDDVKEETANSPGKDEEACDNDVTIVKLSNLQMDPSSTNQRTLLI